MDVHASFLPSVFLVRRIKIALKSCSLGMTLGDSWGPIRLPPRWHRMPSSKESWEEDAQRKISGVSSLVGF